MVHVLMVCTIPAISCTMDYQAMGVTRASTGPWCIVRGGVCCVDLCYIDNLLY